MDEIEELKRRLKEMTAEAANNETILKRTQARELSLLRADSLAQLLRAMVDGLRESYSLDAISVVLLDPQHEIRHLLLASALTSSSRSSSSIRWWDSHRSSPPCTNRGSAPSSARIIICCSLEAPI